MKKIILLLVVATTFLSCSIDDNKNDNYQYEVLPVTSYTVPESFTLGKTYEIKLKYQKPTSCYFFQGIYYTKELNTRTIGIQAAVNLSQNCSIEKPELSEVSFNFIASEKGTYIFKFYQGKDAEGKDLFENKEVAVVE